MTDSLHIDVKPVVKVKRRRRLHVEVPSKGTSPERQLWAILDEMVAEGKISKFYRNEGVDTPFRDYTVEADVLVDGVLVVEVQCDYWHSRKTRAKKDRHKRDCFYMMGFGVLWLYDDELRKATIPKYRSVWRPVVKEWIVAGLRSARIIEKAYLAFKQVVDAENKAIVGKHPVYGKISLYADERRL